MTPQLLSPAPLPSASVPAGPAPGAGGRAGRVANLVTLPLADVLALATAAAVAGRQVPVSALYALAVLTVLAASGMHRLRICLRAADQAGRIATAVALPLLVLLPWLDASGLETGAAARQAAWSAGLLVAFRVTACAALRAAHRRGLLTQAALVVGIGALGAHLVQLMRDHPELGLRPAGYLDHGPPRRDLWLASLGTPADLAGAVSRLRIRRVIICYPDGRDEDLIPVLRASRPLRADVCLVPRLYELGAAVPRSGLDEIWGIPLIPLRRRPGFLALAAKRAFDLTGAAVLLAVAAPAMLAAAAAIRLQSGGPALFRQTRVTGDGRSAQVLKLRTLGEHGDPDTSWISPAQPSTALTRWLRVTHADELPQLVNVLRGEMSLVGPRPERPYFAGQFSREIVGYGDRTRMPAGMTGWAQVHGLNGDTSIAERARFDNQYIEYWSPWMDVVIMARTLAAAMPWRRGDQR